MARTPGARTAPTGTAQKHKAWAWTTQPRTRLAQAAKARTARLPVAWARWAHAAGDRGMATAEYAIVTVAAAGFAGLLVVVLRSNEVKGLLTGIIRSALSI